MPVPRDIEKINNDPTYTLAQSQSPVPLDSRFVCRNMPASTKTTVTAGAAVDFSWNMNIPHTGDCFFYISYDSTSPDEKKEWFKIAEIRDCNKINNTPVKLYIPDYLPACEDCILRWEWYSLDGRPSIQYYTQCADLRIVSTATPGSTPTPLVTVPANMPADGTQYRDARTADAPFFFTGPLLAFPQPHGVRVDGGQVRWMGPVASDIFYYAVSFNRTSNVYTAGKYFNAARVCSMPAAPAAVSPNVSGRSTTLARSGACVADYPAADYTWVLAYDSLKSRFSAYSHPGGVSY
eukprot:CAMPEP_0177659096 /NCGR_PEP_ID=MMETSP0447-20121125/17243_1 /TAXON_ID=0 /ORGANISM="Stygamoeba regulata, Strain BSH-02190019" /LENGTH=292 /DNA_ID=CAMNT_0019163909 /DNA_START=68 /DNA_END=946 /DNA_ORIENTATION=-